MIVRRFHTTQNERVVTFHAIICSIAAEGQSRLILAGKFEHSTCWYGQNKLLEFTCIFYPGVKPVYARLMLSWIRISYWKSSESLLTFSFHFLQMSRMKPGPLATELAAQSLDCLFSLLRRRLSLYVGYIQHRWCHDILIANSYHHRRF